MTQARRAKRNRRILIACLIAGAALIIGTAAIGLRIFDYPLAARQLDRSVAEYRAAGLPWTADELVPPVRPEENAAPELSAALKQFEGEKFKGLSEEFRASYRAKDKAKMAQIFRDLDPVLAKLTAASHKPKLNYERDWDQSLNVHMPEIFALKTGAWHLRNRVIFRATTGDLSGAISDIQTLNRLGQLQAQEPGCKALLISVNCHLVALDAALLAAEIYKNDPASLQELQAAVINFNSELDTTQAFRGDAYVGIALTRNYDKVLGDMAVEDAPIVILDNPQRDGVPTGMTHQAYMVRHIQARLRIQEELRRPGATLLSATLAIDDQFSRIMAGLPRFSEYINLVLYPDYSTVAAAVELCAMQKEFTFAILESLLYRCRTGELPANLWQLGINLVDPVSGDPATFVAENDTIRISMFGLDRVDDGGKNDDWIAHFPLEP